jgi:hypothetical protein
MASWWSNGTMSKKLAFSLCSKSHIAFVTVILGTQQIMAAVTIARSFYQWYEIDQALVIQQKQNLVLILFPLPPQCHVSLFGQAAG